MYTYELALMCVAFKLLVMQNLMKSGLNSYHTENHHTRFSFYLAVHKFSHSPMMVTIIIVATIATMGALHILSSQKRDE